MIPTVRQQGQQILYYFWWSLSNGAIKASTDVYKITRFIFAPVQEHVNEIQNVLLRYCKTGTVVRYVHIREHTHVFSCRKKTLTQETLGKAILQTTSNYLTHLSFLNTRTRYSKILGHVWKWYARMTVFCVSLGT